ncbi:transcription factor [Fusarium pseudoanthophilum]|uniref:Transcription factor n=1 Tax=Fusarium pseudoanthophilum TaxID=48495 RepID=A0A8H5KTB5_9HYPO|nr:transcription factor [Fusarium pseudoanthophilum]
MFSTLRQTFGDGDRLLSVEIAPPFDKDRTSMRTACERCRAQKCVSGENGCMLCVAKNRKCEYLVISRPQRRTSSVASGGSKSRNGDDEDDDDDDNNNAVVNQHKQAQQARRHKLRSRAQSMRQSSPLTTHLSSPKDHQRVITAPQPSPQDSNNNNIAAGPDVGLDDAEQQFLSTLFPDTLGQMPPAFPHFDPGFFGNIAGLTPTATSESQAGHSGAGITAEALTTRGDSSEQSNHTSVYSSSSADSLFEYGIDPMDFLLDESRVSTAVAYSSAHDTNRATTKARPTTTHSHSSTPPGSVATSTASSSCCCMMTAVSIYETMQAQLVWGDPIAGPSTASTPSSTSAGSSYSSGPSWSGSESGSGIGAAATAYQSTSPLMTQQTILKRQKMILLRCDSLVQCRSCWSRPDFVMLVMTMCDRILTSLEAVERFVCSRNDDELNKASTNGTATALDVQAMATASRAGLEVPSLSRSSQMLQPGVGAWQIDDDDEMELVISLIKSRVTRLGNLITMAEGTISANAWPWHERLVQALRKRSNKILISLSFRHFA